MSARSIELIPPDAIFIISLTVLKTQFKRSPIAATNIFKQNSLMKNCLNIKSVSILIMSIRELCHLIG